MKLEPRFSLRCWVKDTTIDTEFGKIKISQDKITHHYTIKDAVEKCYQNVQVGPTLATLLGKRLQLIQIIIIIDHLKNTHNIQIAQRPTVTPLLNLDCCWKDACYFLLKKQTAIMFVDKFNSMVQLTKHGQIYYTYRYFFFILIYMFFFFRFLLKSIRDASFITMSAGFIDFAESVAKFQKILQLTDPIKDA